ncbi:MAG: haloacid dehalogenase [Acidimicrobiales bacterium]
MIQSSAASIRAVHRLDFEAATQRGQEAEAALDEAHGALADYPSLAATGPLHDAQKEYAEARLTLALVTGGSLPSPAGLSVSSAAWLNGLAEGASELRRHALDRLRDCGVDRAEELLAAMDDVYGILITFDYPDAVTGGLRRTTDALRGVLERTRGDVTTAVLGSRLQSALEATLQASSGFAGRPPEPPG